MDFDISGNGKVGIITQGGSQFEVYDLEEGFQFDKFTQLKEDEVLGESMFELKHIALSEDGLWTALASNKDVYLYNNKGEKIDEYNIKLFNQLKDLRFSEDGKFVLMLTEKGIYRWNPIGRYIPQLEKVITNESLKEEVDRHLDEFNGQIIYSVKDAIFHRKVMAYLMLAFIGFMLVNHMMYEWDKGFKLKVAYAAPTYGMLILLPISLQTMTGSKEDLYSYFNFMQMLFLPFLALLAWHSYKDFNRKNKKAWAIAYAFVGLALIIIDLYLLARDFYKIWAVQELFWGVLVIFVATLIFVSIMRFTVRCHYRKQKKKFVFMNIVFGGQMLLAFFLFLAILFG